MHSVSCSFAKKSKNTHNKSEFNGNELYSAVLKFNKMQMGEMEKLSWTKI